MQINQIKGATHASTENFRAQNISNTTGSNHFDDRLDSLLDIAEELLKRKGVFHLTLHFSSSQLSCCTFDNPYSFQLYTAEDVFSENFMRHFAPLESKLNTKIEINHVRPILNSLKWLRSKKHGSELRNASLHLVNGYIGLSFACDDTRYINFRELILPSLSNNG